MTLAVVPGSKVSTLYPKVNRCLSLVKPTWPVSSDPTRLLHILHCPALDNLQTHLSVSEMCRITSHSKNVMVALALARTYRSMQSFYPLEPWPRCRATRTSHGHVLGQVFHASIPVPVDAMQVSIRYAPFGSHRGGTLVASISAATQAIITGPACACVLVMVFAHAHARASVAV